MRTREVCFVRRPIRARRFKKPLRKYAKAFEMRPAVLKRRLAAVDYRAAKILRRRPSCGDAARPARVAYVNE